MAVLADFLEQVYFPLRLPATGTRDEYAGTVRRFERWAADHKGLRLEWPHITAELIGAHLAWMLDRGLAVPTILKHRRTLRAVLAVAKRRKLLKIRLKEIPRPKSVKKHPVSWSQAEFERLVITARAMPGTVGLWPVRLWLPALLLTCYSTDWRITCVMGIRTADVCLAGAWAKSVEPKTHEERISRLVPQCVAALSAIWSADRAEVFGDWTQDRNCRQWPKLNDLLGECIRLAGVRDIGRYHAIRKTATTMVAKSAGRDAAARFAGHRNPAITTAYYIDPTHLDELTESHFLPELRLPPTG